MTQDKALELALSGYNNISLSVDDAVIKKDSVFMQESEKNEQLKEM